MSAVPPSPTPDPSRATSPYVGPRPYEREESHLLFGRARDAGILCDKIFSSRLTLLYAPSGLGKSSMLRALVVPELERQEAQPIYFDAWAGEDPTAALRLHLVGVARRLGIPRPESGSPTLCQLAALIARETDCTPVLILDQFEEFLINHARRLGPFRSELAALVKNVDVDARVVLSLRQEFLAALEPFREEILGLFDSTYLLGPLDDAGARDAIERPANLFGLKYEPKLVERLLVDLRLQEDPEAAAHSSESVVDLPVLQLVCGRLFEAASPSSTEITVKLYEDQRLAAGILDDYVREVMPKRRRDQVLTAGLLKLLAPSSGFKRPFTANELAETGGLEIARVTAEVERLAHHRILRTRAFRRQTFYELEHDALIRLLTPWRLRVERRDRRRVWLQRLAGSAVALLLLSLLAWAWDIRQENQRSEAEYRRQAKTIDRELDRLPFEKRAERLEEASRFFLMERGDAASLEDLRRVLQRNVKHLPPGYAIPERGLNFLYQPVDPGAYPLGLTYSSRLGLDSWQFLLAWYDLAQGLARKGLPIPLRLRLEEKPELSTRSATLSHGDRALAVAMESAELRERKVPLWWREGSSGGPADPFFERFRQEWRPTHLTTLMGERVYVVPLWSLPVWKIAGLPVGDRNGLLAVMVAEALVASPEHVLDADTVGVLLDRLGDSTTLEEARSARGPRLPSDLAELLRQGRPLTPLYPILDALAAYPRTVSSEEVARRLAEQTGEAAVAIPEPLHGPWPRQASASTREPGPRPAAYDELRMWLPRSNALLQIGVTKAQEATWREGGRWARPLAEHLELMSDELYRTLGLELEPPAFGGAFEDGQEAGAAFWVDVLGDSPLRIEASEEDPSEALVRALRSLVLGNPGRWITAETTQSLLQALPEETSDWLRAHYSVTDLKRLLRATLEQEDAGHGGIRHAGWLLRSLVLWNAIDSSRDLHPLADRLMRLQGARAEPAAPAKLDPRLESALDALAEDRIHAAERGFRRALGEDRQAAIEALPRAWAARLPAMQERFFGEQCEDPASARLSRPARLDLEDLLARGGPSSRDADLRWRLCAFFTLPASYPEKRDQLLADLLARYPDPRAWDPKWAADFALAAFSGLDPIAGDPTRGAAARRFLSAALERLDAPQRVEAVSRLRGICDGKVPSSWCWESAYRIGRSSSDPGVVVEIALSLAWRETRTDVDRALELVDRVDRELAVGAPPAAEGSERSLATFARALALSRRSVLEGTDAPPEVYSLLDGLIQEGTLAEQASGLEADVLVWAGRLDDARRLLPNLTPLSALHSRLVLALRGNDPSELDRIVTDAAAIEEASDDKTSVLFVAALSALLSPQTPLDRSEELARRFLQTGHEYVPYIAMILSSRMARNEALGEEAREVLEALWKSAHRGRWDERLRAGDESAWREMLLGYYLGEVRRDRIFGPLEDDQRFEHSELMHLPFTRLGLLCEASLYDALRAEAQGDATRRIQSLRRAVETNYRSYYELRIAEFLLAQEPRVATQ